MPIAVLDDFPRLDCSVYDPPDPTRYGGPIGPYFRPSLRSSDDTGPFQRLVVRLSWKTPMGFIPMAFVCHTAAPGGVYLSEYAMKQMVAEHQLVTTKDGVTATFWCEDGPVTVAVSPTPKKLEPQNLFGLSALMRLGLTLDSKRFFFRESVKWMGGEGFPPVSEAVVRPIPANLYKSPIEMMTSVAKIDGEIQSLVFEQSYNLERLKALEDMQAYNLERLNAVDGKIASIGSMLQGLTGLMPME